MSSNSTCTVVVTVAVTVVAMTAAVVLAAVVAAVVVVVVVGRVITADESMVAAWVGTIVFDGAKVTAILPS